MSEEMTKREERKEEVKEAKKKQRKGKKLTRHEKKVIKKNAKREQRFMFLLLAVLILVMLYFTDMFGLFDFPGNGFGEGYTSFSQQDEDGENKEDLGKVDSFDDVSQNDKTDELITTPEVNQEEKAETTPAVEKNDEDNVTPTIEPTKDEEVGIEAIEVTIVVKRDDYYINDKLYTLDEVEALVKDETKNYIVKLNTMAGRPEACDKLRDLLRKYNKYE